MEEEADWVALETTRYPAAARGLFGKFTTLALSYPIHPVVGRRYSAAIPPCSSGSSSPTPGATATGEA